MKNILIPSTLREDTIQAVEVALNDTKPTTITLLLITEPDDSASASSWLRLTAMKPTPSEQNVLEKCFELASRFENCHLRIRQQYAITGPLLRRLLEYLEIGMVIIPESFSQSTKPVNRHCLKLLRKGRYPLLQLAGTIENPAFSKALFIQQNENVGRIGELLGSLEGFSNLDVVGQVAGSIHSLVESNLFDTIHRKNIDLLVETRRPEKIKFGRQTALTEKLELPVLSLYEPLT